ncbi:MAG TPA: polysaccharide pyruvyl transferase family protein [Xanthobacteraceae bacterium]|nr:polysaccharide pyruvyl transferase family protein [Xanthobacteraceae bacterium]
MTAARQTIGLLGLFGHGNFGNDGSLEAMVAFLRRVRPQADLVCICSGTEIVERVYGLRTVAVNWPPPSNRIVRAIDAALLRFPSRFCRLIQKINFVRKVDVIIVPGTGILDDFGERPLNGMPATLFVWSLLARLFGTKFAFVSVGAGPIYHPLSRWLFKSAARMARYRSYRDRYSKEFMTGIGIDTRDDPQFPDLAFALPSPERAASAQGRPLRVGVGIMSYYGWRGEVKTGAAVHEKYIAEITRFVRWLVDSGHHVRLLTGDIGDKQAVDEVMTLAAGDRPQSFRDRIIAEDAMSLSDVMRQIATTDIVIASRFHNLVCALKLGLPAISVSYAKKNDELLREAGLGEFRQSIEELDAELLIRQFTKLLAERDKYIKTVAATTAAYRTDLQRQEALLLNKIL